MKPTNPNNRRWSGIFLFIGILTLCVSVFLIWERYNPYKFTFRDPDRFKNSVQTPDSFMPDGIIIPAINISLPVFPVLIHGSDWPTTNRGVSYISSSGVPGKTGNAVFYGHNWPNLLGKLNRIKPGNKIFLIDRNKNSLEFTVEYTLTVTPDQTHILFPTADRRLTIYTCTGFLDTKRFVAVAIKK